MPLKPFDPNLDGFPFVNSWTLDPATVDQLSTKLKAATGVVDSFLAPFPVLNPLHLLVADTVNRLTQQATTQTFGLCGGMAFAALDYWRCGQPIPSDATLAQNVSPALRSYLVKRMVDSLCPENLGRVLAWMVVLHLLPFGSGAQLLCGASHAEWDKLKGLLSDIGPWPIALIGDTWNPCENHQVLAFAASSGEEDTIYVYDMNHPGAGRKITVDFHGPALVATEEFPDEKRGPLRGFFCEDYTQAQPV